MPVLQSQLVVNQMMILVVILMAREMVRKGIALWKAGTKKQLAWFICLFIFNTLGLLPIIYLIFFQRKNKAVAKVAVKATKITRRIIRKKK